MNVNVSKPRVSALTTRVMRSNKSHGNESTEIALLKLMRSNGIRGWRRRVKLTGSPDFVFTRERVALFVDGCFWHGCKCRKLPVSNVSFWKEKFRTNRIRDLRVSRSLRQAGWQVVRIKEHEIKKQPHRVLRRLLLALTKT